MSYKKYSYLLAYKINKYIITDWWFRAITMKTPSSPSKNLITCWSKKIWLVKHFLVAKFNFTDKFDLKVKIYYYKKFYT